MAQELVKAEIPKHLQVSKEELQKHNPLEASDIIIPKILLMQSDSKLVEDGKAANKDFVNSSSKEVMTDIEFVPFNLEKIYKVSRKIGNRTEFVREEPWLNSKEMDKEWDEGNDTYISQKVWRFYIIECSKKMPFVLDLRGMSYSAGMRLSNKMYFENQMEGLPASAYTLKLAQEKQEYEGATKNTFTYEVSGFTEENLYALATKWRDTIFPEGKEKSAEYKVEETEEEPVREPQNSQAPATESFAQDDLPF